MIILLKKVLISLLCVIFLFPKCAYAYSASSYIAMDAYSGTVLQESNAYSPMPMASTTKIMTCLIACESTNLEDIVTVTEEMLYDTAGTSLYLKAGDRITFLDLIKGALLASGNDAANAIAFYVSGSCEDFVSLMNKRASEIGMLDTIFETPSGLDKGNHHSTAYDMALLASFAVQNEIFSSICSQKSMVITINDTEQPIYNHNKLLSYDENFIGVKTGFTKKSGRCLVSAYRYYNNIIVTVTLNAPDDWNDHMALVEACKPLYSQYQVNDIYNIMVVGSHEDSVQCAAKGNIYSVGEVQKKAFYYPMIYAPVKTGDVVGREEIYYNDKLIMTVDITVRKDIEICQTMK